MPRGRALTPGELRALFAVVAEDPRPATRARDAALLAVLYGGGLRRAEVITVNVGDYNSDTGALTIRHGKGRRERIMYATNGAGEALAAWLTLRGREGTAVLPGEQGGSHHAAPDDNAGRLRPAEPSCQAG